MVARTQTKVTKIQVIVVEEGKIWAVLVNGDQGSYQVVHEEDVFSCNCPSGLQGKFCQHKKAVMEVEQIKEEVKEKRMVPGKDRNDSRTKSGYVFGEVASAIQKEIRLGNEEGALYWAKEMYDTSPYYLWKRMMVIASEDIGLAAPDVVVMVNALAGGWEQAKKTSWYVSPHQMVQCVLALCRAPKSTEVDDAICWDNDRRKKGYHPDVPDYALDMHTQAGKERRKAEGLSQDDMEREWYLFRRNEAKIPSNPYQDKLEEAHPEWFNEPNKML